MDDDRRLEIENEERVRFEARQRLARERRARIWRRLRVPLALLGLIGIGLGVALPLTLGGGSEHLILYRTPSSSMEPTLHCARPGSGCESSVPDYLRARPLDHRQPVRGEVLAFQTPPEAEQKCGSGGTFIKRVIGLPADTVSEKLVGGKGTLFINGHKLIEPYIDDERRDQMTGIWHVPKSEYFFLGDNRVQSCDSREWGAVPYSNLRGTIVQVFRLGKWTPFHLVLPTLSP